MFGELTRGHATPPGSVTAPPLASLSTGSGRTPPHPWHGAASDEEVRRIVGEDLGRLGQHPTAALADEHDDKVRAALAEIERGLLVHLRALNEV
jgi:hypothetical protein